MCAAGHLASVTRVRCPHCDEDLNDDHPACPACRFHIADLDPELGPPPPRQGDVLDRAGVLAPEERARIAERIARLRAGTGADLAVVTVPTTAPRKPSEYAFWLFNRWGVGGVEHAGVLVVLALAERRIEAEVGVALEDRVTDEASGVLLEEHAVPFLRAGRLGEGLYQACDLLAQLVERPRRRWWPA